MTDYGNIVKRADGSYIINDGMYHVPNESDFAALWAAVDAYAIGHPACVTDEVVAQPTLIEVQVAKRNAINAGFDAAMTASMTMPSATPTPSAFSVYQAIERWQVDDPEGYASLLAIHSARRDELLAAVEAAETAEEVQAITVNYAV